MNRAVHTGGRGLTEPRVIEVGYRGGRVPMYRSLETVRSRVGKVAGYRGGVRPIYRSMKGVKVLTICEMRTIMQGAQRLDIPGAILLGVTTR